MLLFSPGFSFLSFGGRRGGAFVVGIWECPKGKGEEKNQ